MIIDSLGSSPLQDGVTYWIGAVASDDWGNSNVNSVLVVEATPRPIKKALPMRLNKVERIDCLGPPRGRWDQD